MSKKKPPKLIPHDPNFQTLNVCDPNLELIDPNPDIHNLFIQFDNLFFNSLVQRSCVIRWSTRMTLCAGTCTFDGAMNVIALSNPLLKLRPRSDTINTLLHEMIHAYLFLTMNNRDRDGHGPNFQAHMYRINKMARSNITIYHTFHDEVSSYRTHVWKCDGVCQQWKPYFGICKRSMNRPPQKADNWFASHQKKCGGTFHKISGPDVGKKKSISSSKSSSKPKSILEKPRQVSVPNKSNKNKNPNLSKNTKSSSKTPEISNFFKKKIESQSENIDDKENCLLPQITNTNTNFKGDAFSFTGWNRKTSRLLDLYPEKKIKVDPGEIQSSSKIVDEVILLDTSSDDEDQLVGQSSEVILIE